MPQMLEWPSNFSRILGPLCKGTIVALNSTFPLCLQYLNITHKQILFSRTTQPPSLLASTLNSVQPGFSWVSLSWGSCLDQIGIWVWLCAFSWLIGVVDVGGPTGWHQPQAFGHGPYQKGGWTWTWERTSVVSVVSASSSCPVGVLALMSLKDGLSSVTWNEFFPH